MTRRRELDLGSIIRRYGTYVLLFVMIIISTILKPNVFLTKNNLISILVQISMIIILACGECVVIIGGGTDLSAGSVVAMTGTVMVGVYITTKSIIIAFIVAAILGATIGFLNGFIKTQFDLPPFIVTLGTQILARGIAFVYSGGMPIPILDDEKFKILGQGKFLGIPNPIYVAAIVSFFAIILMSKTSFGRSVYAIGGNVEAARASGIKVNRILIISYMLMGFLASVSGYILMSRINVGQPNAALNYEFDAIIGVVLGGTSFSGGVGTVGGSIVGCIIMGVLGNIMNLMNIPPNWQYIAKGIIILLAVILDSTTKSVSNRSKAKVVSQ